MAKLQILVIERTLSNDRPKVSRKKSFIPINELRNRSFEKLKIKEESKFSNQEIIKINDLLQSFRPQCYDHYLGVIAQIERDITLQYKKYDSLVRWLDADDGLSKYEPDLIRNIAMECGLC